MKKDNVSLNRQVLLYKIGCWSFVFTGLGHSIVSLLSPDTPAKIEMIELMRAYSLESFSSNLNLYMLHEGFSFMMGLMIIAFGAVNLLVFKEYQSIKSSLLVLNMMVALIAMGIAVVYFFFAPIILLSLSFACFTTVIMLRMKSEREQCS